MTPRRPLLKIVDRLDAARSESDSGRVQHDSRGNAVWSAPVDLEATLDLELQIESAAAPSIEGDPYNRGPTLRNSRKLR